MNRVRSSNLAVRSWACGLALLAALPLACGDDDGGGDGTVGGGGGDNESGASGRAGSSTGGRGGNNSAGSTQGGTDGSGGTKATGGTNSSGTGGEGENGGANTGGTASGGTASGGTSGGTAGSGTNGGQAGGGQAGEGGGGQGGESGGQAGLGGTGGNGEGGEAGSAGAPTLPLTNITGNGWVSAEYAELAAKAFDGDHDTKWLTFNSSSWLQYEFLTAPQSVQAYGLVSGNDFENRDPRDWVLLGNNTGPDGDDGSDSEWTVLDTRSAQDPFTNRNELRKFNVTTPGSFLFYRLKVTANNGSETLQLSEVELYTTGDVNVIAGAHGTDQFPKDEGPEAAFDHSPETKWLTYSSTAWLQYEFRAVTHPVESYVIVSGNDAPDRDPRSWVLLGNNTGPDGDDDSDSEWSVLDTQTDQGPFAQRNQRYTFATANPGGFKFYRLKVTENNGEDILQFSELELLAR